MVNGKYETTQGMIDKIQQLKSKTKLEFYQNISNYCDEMNNRRRSNSFQFKENPFSKSAEGSSKSFHEVSLLLKYLQTKRQVMNMNKIYYDLYYTVIKNREDKEIVNDENEND